MTDRRKTGVEMQDWNLADQIAGLENAELEYDGPISQSVSQSVNQSIKKLLTWPK